jgi:DNA-binding CsgD family transcriptional regulator
MIPALTAMEPSSNPPTKLPTSYPASLTAREGEVLRLVAQRLTDAQVAEQLVISLRHHPSHLDLQQDWGYLKSC